MLDRAAETPPGTVDYLRFRAGERPGAPALIYAGVTIPYARFAADLNRFGRVVGGFGLAPGALVAVECEDVYIHWLLLLACELHGLASASIVAGSLPGPGPILSRAALVFHQHPLEAAAGKAVALDGAMVAAALAGDPDDIAQVPRRLDAPARLRRSSGTTGIPKLMMATRAREERSLEVYLLEAGMTGRSRFLALASFTIGNIYLRATLALRLGATVIADTGLAPAASIARHRPTHLRLLNQEAAAILDALPAGFARPPGLTLMMGSSPLAPAFRQRLVERLAGEIVYCYSCNETGTIAEIDEQDVAALLPGVELELVDDRDQPVPPGAVGQVRVRVEGMVEGYLDDPEATARHFRDGWFYPGDLAAGVGPRRIRLAGRVDDVVNLGGRKVLPAEVEAIAWAAAALDDVAVTGIAAPDGSSELAVALVLPPDGDFAGTVERLRATLPPYLGRVHFARFARLPRNQAGKLIAAELRAALAAGRP